MAISIQTPEDHHEAVKMLDLKKVKVVYHSVSMAIQGVSFKLNQGEIFALIGANGAGKTTTLRAISGFSGQTMLRLLTVK